MGEIALRRFFLAVFCALALSLSALAADAALPSLEAAGNVREDGVCEVTMTAEVDFSAAQDSLLIPLGTDARDITLAGWSYETVLQDGVTCLKLSNPVGFSGKQQFTCSYTLPCRAAEAADGQQFRLSLPETGWDYAIDSYSLTMTFPAEVTNAPEWTSGYYGDVVDNYLDIRTQENTVTAKSTAAMRDHETLTVSVQFPADTFNLRDQPGKTAGFDRIAFLVLLAAVSLEVARVYGSRLPELRSKSQALDAQIQQTEKQNDVLRSDLDHEGDPDFIQGLARDDLGLASDGERIFYDVNN